MDFNDWMSISERVIGKEGMDVFKQFVLGSISFEDCINQMYETMPQENILLLYEFMNIVKNEV